MAKLGDLVVRIGADTRGLNKSLGKVQRNMRSMTSNFTKLGTSMTKSITLPLLGIAAMAVKSAADLETLETSFISLTGGVEEAAAMMKQLNEFTAKTPFQIDAVATSARQLIASGTKLSEVNETLQFLGDIAATSGKPINELASIFAKVNAKGKVELESLNQLAERGIPVFKGLAEATGKLPSELGAGGVTVQQFNDYLKGLSKEGGMAHGAMERLSQTASGKFSTAMDNLKLAGAALAEDLLPVISDLLDYVVELAQSFTDLSPSTKKMILIFGGVASAIGPLLLIIPSLVSSMSILGGAFVALKVKVLALNVSMLANPYVLAGAAIVALGVILVKTAGDIKNSRKETNLFIQSLKGLDKQATINAVNEKIREKTDALTKATKSLEISKIQAARATDKFDRQIANQSVSRYTNIVEGLNGSLEDLEAALEDAKAVGLDPFVNTTVIEADKESLKTFGDGVSDITAKLFELQGMGTTAFATLSNGVQDFVVSSTPQLLSFLNDFSVAVENTAEVVAESVDKMADDMNQAISSGVATMISGVAEMVGTAIGAQKPIENMGAFLGNTLGDMAIQLGKYAIVHGTVIEAIKKSLKDLNGVTAIVAGTLLIALGAGIKGQIAKAAESAGIPALAEGGLAYGPTLAMVGDNKGANIDPEVVAPLSKLKGMLGGNAVQVYGRISGDDIVISNSRASRDRNRF
jgi:tape measure domain-containing protein